MGMAGGREEREVRKREGGWKRRECDDRVPVKKTEQIFGGEAAGKRMGKGVDRASADTAGDGWVSLLCELGMTVCGCWRFGASLLVLELEPDAVEEEEDCRLIAGGPAFMRGWRSTRIALPASVS